MKKVYFTFAMVSLLMTSCINAQSGERESQSIDQLTGFDAISLGTAADVVIEQGDYNVEISGDEEAIAKTEILVEDGNLVIRRDKNSGMFNWGSRRVQVAVRMPNLSGINIGGSGDVTIKDRFDSMGDLTVNVGGSGDVEFAGGIAKKVSINVAGSGDVDASNVDGASCEVSIAGSGDVKVGNMEALEVSIAGSGDVSYRGNPRVEKSVVGSGDVRKM